MFEWNDGFYYIAWKPNWLKKEYRYVGYLRMWHDGPHSSIGFWWFNISWRTPLTIRSKERERDLAFHCKAVRNHGK